jgi:hypothetical protein
MYFQNILLAATAGLACSPLVSGRPAKRQTACTPDAIARPKVFGLEILELSAAEHLNETTLSLFSKPPASLTVSYCGVTVTYTHPGWNDTVNVLIWLPLENWNG